MMSIFQKTRQSLQRIWHPKWITLGAALTAGGIAAISAHHYLRAREAEIDAKAQRGPKISVLVAKTDLSVGAALTPATVAIREMPTEWVQSNALRPADFDHIGNAQLAVALKSGEQLLSGFIAQSPVAALSSQVATGHRAITLPVDEINSLSGMLMPGDFIDLIVSVPQRGKRITFPLLQRVRVMATGQKIGAGESEHATRSFTTVTLDTTPQAAQQLIAARQLGSITALLRHPTDENLIADGPRDAGSWLGLGSGNLPPRPKNIQVIYGGRARLARIAPLTEESNALSETEAFTPWPDEEEAPEALASADTVLAASSALSPPLSSNATLPSAPAQPLALSPLVPPLTASSTVPVTSSPQAAQ